MLIANNLVKLRNKVGAKQSDIAAVAGVSQGIYSMAETGQGALPWEALWKLCAHYSVDPDEIYPVWLLKEAYKINIDPPKPKVRTAVSVKIPIAIAEEVDKLVENGEYINRADFVVTAVRKAIHG